MVWGRFCPLEKLEPDSRDRVGKRSRATTVYLSNQVRVQCDESTHNGTTTAARSNVFAIYRPKPKEPHNIDSRTAAVARCPMILSYTHAAQKVAQRLPLDAEALPCTYPTLRAAVSTQQTPPPNDRNASLGTQFAASPTSEASRTAIMTKQRLKCRKQENIDKT